MFPLHSRIIASACLIVTFTVSAQDFSWDSGGSDFKYETAQNWATDTVPVFTERNKLHVALKDGGTMSYDSLTGTQSIDILEIANGSTFNMMGGVFDHARSGSSVRTYVGSGGALSTLNHSGGQLEIGHILRIGHKKGSGVYNLTGGSLRIYRAGNTMIGAPSGASISIGDGDAASEMNISGGELATRFGVEIAAASTFRVSGNDAETISIGGSRVDGYGTWYQEGTLSAQVGIRGLTKIKLVKSADTQHYVTFARGSELDLGFHDTEPYSGTWTILELEGADITDEGLVLSKRTLADPGWSFEIDNSGPNGRLIAKYRYYADVPEPMSYSMILGVCSLFWMLARRRRR